MTRPISQVSSLINTLTLNSGDPALEDLSPDVRFGYFAVVCDGPELQLLDNHKAKAVRALMKTRNYYQKHGIIPVAVMWMHNQHLFSTLDNLGYLVVCANAKDLPLEARALYAKTAETTPMSTFAFKVCYWVRLPDNLTDELDFTDSAVRKLIDERQQNGSTIIELDAGVVPVSEYIAPIRNPEDLVNKADQSANQPGDAMKYIDFQAPDLTHPIDKTLPLVVPEGVLDIHERQQHIIGLGT